MNIDEMDRSANAAAQLLKALASPVRLKILCQLVDGEKAVGQLAELLQARDALVSQHLALLRKDGLVRTRREAQTIWYSIASPAAERIIRTLYEVFCAGGGPDSPDGDDPR